MKALRLLAWFVFASPLFAQSAPTTSLLGTVVDPTGAAVPSAVLELTNAGTNWTKKTESDAQGRYLFTLVPPGVYDLSVSASGFAGFRQRAIRLDADVPATVNLSLAVAGTTTAVTIQAEAPMVDAQSGTVRQVVGEDYIQQLPLQGRNAATLVYMAPGTVLGRGIDSGTYATNSDTIAVSANGAMGDQVSYKLDGSSHTDNLNNLNAGFPNPDALSQFTVETNNFDAQYGGSGGAVVNIVTKTGTNAIHGSAFEYLRNGDLNARNFFAPQQDAIKRSQFGGTIGGPVKRDKLFYFGSWQRTILSNITYGNTAFVPTAAERTGDFTGQKTIKDPVTGIAYPNNVIPASQLSPIALAMMPHIPTSADPTGKLLYAQPSSNDNQQFLSKVDYNAGAHQINASLFRIHYTDPGWNAGGTLLNYKIGQDQTTHSFKAGDTWSITPNLVNSLNFAGLILNSVQTRTAPFSIFDFGNINATKPATQFQETGITVTGFSGWGSGGTQPPGTWIRDNFELTDILTWMHGGHSVHFGGTFVPWSRFDSSTGYQEEPILTFTGAATNNGLADLLTGRAATFVQTAGKAKFTRGRQANAFIQDQWRVTSRLTLNGGLRWEPFLPWSDPVAGQVGGYIPGAQSTRFPLAPRGMLFAGDPGFPSGGVYNNVGNFAPRLGFAYSLAQGAHPSTIRGGWGLFYIQPFVRLYNNFVQNAPFSPSVSLTGVLMADPFGSSGTQNPFPPFAPVHPNASTTFLLPIAYQFFDPHWHIGHTRGYNLTVEHQFARNLVMRAACVGTQGRDLGSFDEIDPAIYGPGATSSNTNARRPLAPAYASMIEMRNGGVSNYNAFQFTVERRFSSGLSFVANYTFSKNLDNESADVQLTVTNPDPFVPRFNYGLSDLNVTHNFSFFTVCNLPLLAHSPRLIRGAFGGWQSTGIWNWRSGFPINVTSGQDRSLSGINLDRADLVLPNPRVASPSIGQWFNTSAFALAALGTFGDSPRNLLTAPGLFNFDWSFAKTFPISERLRTQLRADFFDMLNTPHFNAPGSSVASTSTFGKISSAADPRILQLSLRVQF
ncbi:MAG TPA: carboxypeptidase regulatory-like domain-containing protein [Bryobacteraceae bacterium]|nr:carboxypeptidase regulatory-like domain-containing protein [Bryobacteraceae bacterium]